MERAHQWFNALGWHALPFQKEAWSAFEGGLQGIVNAPTGSGKTYSLLIPILLTSDANRGLQAIWIIPIRALAKEIHQSAERAIAGMGLDLTVAIRTGDTDAKSKTKIKTNPPNLLITTPETLHLLLAQKGAAKYFKHLRVLVADEWHDLLGSKRGVQIELALSRLRAYNSGLKTWGISATIGNLTEAVDVLMGTPERAKKALLIRSPSKKKYKVLSIFPDDLEVLPWAGHLGIKLIDKVMPIINQSKSTLIFLNTRGQAEIWYQKLLDYDPSLAGIIALHHGSMSREVRHWVEDALHGGQLKAVVCTSSLDLGVDFRPVETIIQVGSPKGVARFMQRAGRSGHQPGQNSTIYFVPTHSLELIEAAALRQAIEEEIIERRLPFIRSFDVLLQYMVTLAVSDGFEERSTYEEVVSTYSYSSVSREEWEWCLQFIHTGGKTLNGYDEFHKVVIEDGLYKVVNRRVAMRHRLSIGTIVSDTMMAVQIKGGKRLGHVAEYFLTRLSPGDNFWFAGQSLELIRIKDMTAQVKRSKKTTGMIPSWQGGRMPLSSELSGMLRTKLNEAVFGGVDPEIEFLQPLIDRQLQASIVPTEDQFLIEYFESKDGYHAVFFPFEGRFVHEGMGALLAYRLSSIQPISFSIAMNDYGFELLSDQPIPLQIAVDSDIFTTDNLMDDIWQSVNSVEMASRKFRDIARIGGLVFNGYPGSQKRDRHLQASAQLFFQVFQDYSPDNLLLRQAFDEVVEFQLEEARMRKALERISRQQIVITKPKRFTPFSFPIIVDRTREKLSSESLADRIKKMQISMH